MIVSDLITTSMRKLGLVAANNPVSPYELQNGLSALQSMLRSWAGEMMNVFATTKENFNFTANKYIYTWGTGGDFNSERPNAVLGAYVLEAGSISHPVDIISEGTYRGITVKNISSRPYALFFHPKYPLADVYLYPVPDASEVLYIDSLKPFTETSSFDDLQSTLSFPKNYEELIIYNLAVRLAPEFGKSVSVEVAAIAQASYDRMIILNAANQVEPILIHIPACAPYGARYSINSDTYH
jgi:hypothetical protein